MNSGLWRFKYTWTPCLCQTNLIFFALNSLFPLPTQIFYQNQFCYILNSAFILFLPTVRPRFTQPSKMRKRVIARPVGSSVRLKCTASGNPRPDIVWLKDSRPLADEDVGAGGEKGKKKRWTLSLKNLTPEHSGKYTCHVSNKAGEINATYKVEVIRESPLSTKACPSLTCSDLSESEFCNVAVGVGPNGTWRCIMAPHSNTNLHCGTTVGLRDLWIHIAGLGFHCNSQYNDYGKCQRWYDKGG